MVKSVAIDDSRRVDIYFRIKRNATIVFSFVDADGNPFPIFDVYTDYDPVLFVKEYPGARTNLMYLNIGNGLEILSDSELQVTLTEALTNIKEGENYWELYMLALGKTFLNGLAYAHNGVFDGVENALNTVVINENGTPVTVTISNAGSERITINTQTDDYTLALSDAYNLVEMDKATANNLTIPNNTNVALPIGSFGFGIQKGVGQTTIVEDAGVTLYYTTGLKINAQYGKFTWLKTGPNEFHISGDLEA